VHTISCTQLQTLTLMCVHMFRIGPHILCGFGRGKLCRGSVSSGEADVKKNFKPPLPTLTPNLLHFKFISLYLTASYRQTWSGFNTCMFCGGIVFPVCAPSSGRDRVAHGKQLPDPLPSPNPTLQHQIIMQMLLSS